VPFGKYWHLLKNAFDRASIKRFDAKRKQNIASGLSGLRFGRQ